MLSIQSGPAGASPTRFRPADLIERLTPEASNVRLHSKPTSTRSAPRSAIGARRRIGAAPLPRRNSQVRSCRTQLGTDRCYGAGGEEMATSSLHLIDGVPRCPAERLEQVPRRRAAALSRGLRLPSRPAATAFGWRAGLWRVE
jgi:hypothetical protein